MSRSLSSILITGFMGAGKSTVAAALARALHCSMIDLDQFVAEMEGHSVPLMIDQRGEEYFRGAETRALREALKGSEELEGNEELKGKRARVIALGGGTWTIARNRELIGAHGGLTIWLDAPFELCWQRITLAGDARPLARDRENAQRLFDARRALYELAALRVQVSEESNAEQLVAEIKFALSQRESER
jgi:shikimate kinase